MRLAEAAVRSGLASRSAPPLRRFPPIVLNASALRRPCNTGPPAVPAGSSSKCQTRSRTAGCLSPHAAVVTEGTVADPIWLHQHGMWEFLSECEGDSNPSCSGHANTLLTLARFAWLPVFSFGLGLDANFADSREFALIQFV